jgi:prepilin signal peptidase PulO-like enzyme (type II secretory pathway)
MIVVIVFAIIGIAAFFGAIKFIKLNDKTINLKMEKEIGIMLIILISTTLIYLKYKFTIDFLFIFYLSIYLIICAYVDKKTMYVYSIFNYFTIIISLIYLISTYNNVYVTKIIIDVIIYIIFSTLMSKLKIYGNGDNEIFIAISLFIAIKFSINPLEALLVNVIIANIVTIILNYKNINIKKMKLNSRIAFAPSIAISTMIMILLL